MRGRLHGRLTRGCAAACTAGSRRLDPGLARRSVPRFVSQRLQPGSERRPYSGKAMMRPKDQTGLPLVRPPHGHGPAGAKAGPVGGGGSRGRGGGAREIVRKKGPGGEGGAPAARQTDACLTCFASTRDPAGEAGGRGPGWPSGGLAPVGPGSAEAPAHLGALYVVCGGGGETRAAHWGCMPHARDVLLSQGRGGSVASRAWAALGRRGGAHGSESARHADAAPRASPRQTPTGRRCWRAAARSAGAGRLSTWPRTPAFGLGCWVMLLGWSWR